MSELANAKARAEITVKHLKTGRVSTHTGRYGTFCECYEYTRKNGYALLQYQAIY